MTTEITTTTATRGHLSKIEIVKIQRMTGEGDKREQLDEGRAQDQDAHHSRSRQYVSSGYRRVYPYTPAAIYRRGYSQLIPRIGQQAFVRA